MKKLLYYFLLVILLFIMGCHKDVPPVVTVKLLKFDTTNITINISATGGNEAIKEAVVEAEGAHATATTGGTTWNITLRNLIPNSNYQIHAYVTTKESGTIYCDSVISVKTYAVIDYDGNGYYAVQIGDQLWTQTNLAVTHYRDGTPIPEVTDSLAWGQLSTGAYCSYQNDTAISNVYGLFYNLWAAFGKDHNLSPKGWRVANDVDWYKLWVYVGGEKSGGKMKEKGYEHWLQPNTGATNTTGFTALGAGMRWVGTDDDKKSSPIVGKNVNFKMTNDEGQWMYFKRYAIFWTDGWLPDLKLFRVIVFMTGDDGFHTNYGAISTSGCSIRLVKE